MSLIFFLSHQPGKYLHLPNISNIDKLFHCLGYSVLGLGYLISLPPLWWQRYRGLVAGSVVLFCLFYGVTDELHQSFVPGRSVSGADLLADVVGGMVALLVFWGWRRWQWQGL